MNPNPARRTIAAAALLGLALVLAGPAQASLADGGSPLQDQIDEVLATYPGGTQTAYNEVQWEDGAIILTLEDPDGGMTSYSVGSCATNRYCAYSGYGLTGSKISFSTCSTTVSTAPVGVVRSIANARSSGYVQAKNASNTVLATVTAGNSLSSAPLGVTKLTCVS